MNAHEENAWRLLIQLGARELDLGGKHALDLSPIRVTSKDNLGLFVQAVIDVVGRSGANRRHVDRRGCPVYVVTDFYTLGSRDRDRHDAETKALLLRNQARKSHERVTERETLTGPLAWILSRPDLRQLYAGQYVAIKECPNFEVVAQSHELSKLLTALGEDVREYYIHQFL